MIYEYECDKCGYKREVMSKKPLELKCKKCGKIMRLLISKSNFILKGTGWPSKDMKGK